MEMTPHRPLRRTGLLRGVAGWNRARLLFGIVLLGAAVSGLTACSEHVERWGEPEVQDLATVADYLAEGVGPVRYQAIDQAPGGTFGTTGGAWGVVDITPIGKPAESRARFEGHLARLGYPIDASAECSSLTPGQTKCLGPYGTVTYEKHRIELAAYKAFFVREAQALP